MWYSLLLASVLSSCSLMYGSMVHGSIKDDLINLDHDLRHIHTLSGRSKLTAEQTKARVDALLEVFTLADELRAELEKMADGGDYYAPTPPYLGVSWSGTLGSSVRAPDDKPIISADSLRELIETIRKNLEAQGRGGKSTLDAFFKKYEKILPREYSSISPELREYWRAIYFYDLSGVLTAHKDDLKAFLKNPPTDFKNGSHSLVRNFFYVKNETYDKFESLRELLDFMHTSGNEKLQKIANTILTGTQNMEIAHSKSGTAKSEKKNNL